jgi:hypothetical protein
LLVHGNSRDDGARIVVSARRNIEQKLLYFLSSYPFEMQSLATAGLMQGNKEMSFNFLEFTFSPCSECRMLSSG